MQVGLDTKGMQLVTGGSGSRLKVIYPCLHRVRRHLMPAAWTSPAREATSTTT